MNIGEAARRSGISAKMIRHYEATGLLPSAGRNGSGYRDYDLADLHRLGFVRNARDLGFPVARIRVLLALWSDEERSNAEVKAIASEHVRELEGRARQLNAMAAALRALAEACDGDGRPDCPIIAGLETGAGATAIPPVPGLARRRRTR